MARASLPAPEDIDSLLLPMAAEGWSHCAGFGVVVRERRAPRACACVWRAIAGAVLGMAERIDAYPSWHPLWGPHGCSRPGEEFLADVQAAQRALERNLQRALALSLEGDWRYCSKRMGLDRGQWFHELYRARQRFGQECYQRGLYPFGVYFHQPSIPQQQHIAPEQGPRRTVARLSDMLPFRQRSRAWATSIGRYYAA